MPRGIIRDPSPPPVPSLSFSLPEGQSIEGPIQTIQDSLRQSLDAQSVAIRDTDGVLGPRLSIQFQPSDHRNTDVPNDVWDQDWYSQTPKSVFTLNTRKQQHLNTLANVKINGTMEPDISVVSMGPADIVAISNNPNENDGRSQRSLNTFNAEAFMLQKPNRETMIGFSRRNFAESESINIEDGHWFPVSAYKGHAVGGGVARYFGIEVEDDDDEEDEEEDDDSESPESDEDMKDDSDRSKSD